MVDPKSVPTVKLSNEKNVPAVGLGTWQSAPDGSVFRAVKGAIENGYRHIDCAFIYQNQDEIGRAFTETMKAGVVKREELFIVSKLWLTYYRKDRVEICVKKILSDLNLSYVDMILLHWPVSFAQVDDTLFPTGEDGKAIEGDVDYTEAWQGLEKLVDEGLIRAIGVSNFTSEQIERLLTVARIKPVVNQVESHPYLAQEKLKAFCEERGIKLTAYSPLGNPGSSVNQSADKDKLLKDEVVNRLATKYNKNAGQILIKFQAQRGVIVIPKSVNLDRIISNIQIFDFELTKEEMAELAALNRNYRSCPFSLIDNTKNYPFKTEIDF